MEELYQLIEEKIRNAGYNGAVDGEEIYSEICDEIEGKLRAELATTAVKPETSDME